MKQPYEVERYRPVPLRRRLLIVVLAVATAVSIMVYMLGRRGDIVRAGLTVQGETAPCSQGRTEGCVGGIATVIAVPPASAPAAAPAASSRTP